MTKGSSLDVLRQQVKTAAAAQPDELIPCLVCGESVKGKSLVRHFDRNHSLYLSASTPSIEAGEWEAEGADSGAFLAYGWIGVFLPLAGAAFLRVSGRLGPIAADADVAYLLGRLDFGLYAFAFLWGLGFTVAFLQGWVGFFHLRLMADGEGLTVARRAWFDRRLSLPARAIVVGGMKTLSGYAPVNSSYIEEGGLLGETVETKAGMFLRMVTASGTLTVRSKTGLSQFTRQWHSDGYRRGKARVFTPGVSTVVTLSPQDFIRFQVWLAGRGVLKTLFVSPPAGSASS